MLCDVLYVWYFNCYWFKTIFCYWSVHLELGYLKKSQTRQNIKFNQKWLKTLSIYQLIFEYLLSKLQKNVFIYCFYQIFSKFCLIWTKVTNKKVFLVENNIIKFRISELHLFFSIALNLRFDCLNEIPKN